jgi:N-methylhydantoinase B
MAIGGCGAAAGRDGWGWPAPQSGIDVSSPEILEQQYGLRVIERRFTEDSAGPGRWRGGPGSRVVVEVERDDLVATALVSRMADDRGIAGGGSGSADRIVIREGTPDALEVDPLAYRQPLAAGDRILVAKGGGPGWGAPFDRPPEAVRDDVVDGYVSVAAARERYGVALAGDQLEVDAATTAKLRSGLTAVP